MIFFRYSDFLVNEISLDGSVVHLTDLEINTQESKVSEPNSHDIHIWD